MTEVEEVKTNWQQKALKRAPRQTPAQLDRIRKDTLLGMTLSNVVAQKSYWSRCHFYPLAAAYRMLKNGTLYQDLGANHFDNRAKGKQVLQLLNCLRNLGFAAQIAPHGGIVQDLSLVRMSTRLSSARDSPPGVPAVLG